jgi:hypothetical protein
MHLGERLLINVADRCQDAKLMKITDEVFAPITAADDSYMGVHLSHACPHFDEFFEKRFCKMNSRG